MAEWLTNDDIDTVNYCLLWHDEEGRDQEVSRNNIIHESSKNIASVSSPGGPLGYSDPCGAKVVRLGGRGLVLRQRWIDIVRRVEAALDEREKVVLQSRRVYRYSSSRSGGWIIPVQNDVQRRCSLLANVTGKELSSIWKSIFEKTVWMAVGEGLIRVRVHGETNEPSEN